MTPLRKIFYYFAGFITLIALLQVPYAFAFTKALSNPNTIDKALQDGGVYDNFVRLSLEHTEQNGDQETKELLADEKFRTAITSSVKSEDIRSASQSVVNGVYAWLEGKTEKPEFTIDLSKPAAQAINAISAYAEERSSKLPVCTLQQLQGLDLQNADLLKLPCIPPGLTSKQIGDRFATQAKNEVDILKNPTLTSSDLFKEGNISTEDYQSAPKAYKNIQGSRWYSLVFAILLLGLMIFARRNRTAGLRVGGILLVSAGLILTVILSVFAVAKLNIPTDNKDAEIALRTIVSVLEQITSTVRWYALGYIAAGIGLLIVSRRLAPPHKTDEPSAPQAAAEQKQPLLQ